VCLLELSIPITYMLVNTCDGGFRAYVRRTKARSPSSKVRQAWNRLIKELKNLIKRMHQTPGIPSYAPLSCRVEPEILCWERQIKVLGDNVMGFS
jgi:hypothetical protein